MSEQEEGAPAAGREQAPTAVLPGERGITSVNRLRSAQSRLTAWIAFGIMLLIGGGVLFWYYTVVYARATTPRTEATKQLKSRAQGEMTLPPLGPIPVAAPVESGPYIPPNLGQPPPSAQPAQWNAMAPPLHYGDDTPQDRRLKGSVFVALGAPEAGVLSALPPMVQPVGPSMQGMSEVPRGTSTELSGLLTASLTPAVSAQRLPTQRLLLPKGAFLDCTLETAIDSTLPGMSTCVTATDTYGADGSVVLLERGSKLVGETRGEVRQGSSRLFVLWTEARTPTGVVIPLASPATDQLGRSGLDGDVDRHFWQRFGAALLISVVDGALQAASSSGSSSVVVGSSGTRDVLTEVLRDTIHIPPTLRKPQGDRIQVLVARDLDFRSVYQLTATSTGREP